MRILVLESDRRAGDDVIDDLRSAGHEVVRCHERDLPVFPCAGLTDGGACPLDEPVDVAVTVRAHPYPRHTAYEDGVICALRHRVPLVVAGKSALSPFAPWTTEHADDGNVVAACERAAVRPVPAPSEAVTDEARRLATAAGLAPETVNAAVVKRSGRLAVDIEVPAAASRELRHSIAVRAAGLARTFDRYADGVDVTVTTP
jgi:hypothetical protein